MSTSIKDYKVIWRIYTCRRTVHDSLLSLKSHHTKLSFSTHNKILKQLQVAPRSLVAFWIASSKNFTMLAWNHRFIARGVEGLRCQGIQNESNTRGVDKWNILEEWFILFFLALLRVVISLPAEKTLFIMVSIADIVVNHWKSSPLRASRVPHAMFSCFHPPKHHIPFHLISSHPHLISHLLSSPLISHLTSHISHLILF